MEAKTVKTVSQIRCIPRAKAGVNTKIHFISKSLFPTPQVVRLACAEFMKIRNLSLSIAFTHFATAGFCANLVIAAPVIITMQEGGAPPSNNAQQLVGHWRKTTIGYTGPIDEHLVLRSNGTVENWTVTAYERREPATGHWNVDGKTLTLSFGGNDRSSPFTFYQGQLVYPNIPNRRGFWEKIE